MKKAESKQKVFDYTEMTSEIFESLMRVENLKTAYELGLFEKIHLIHAETFK